MAVAIVVLGTAHAWSVASIITRGAFNNSSLRPTLDDPRRQKRMERDMAKKKTVNASKPTSRPKDLIVKKTSMVKGGAKRREDPCSGGE